MTGGQAASFPLLALEHLCCPKKVKDDKIMITAKKQECSRTKGDKSENRPESFYKKVIVL
jgi:hypothetical protein